MSLKTICFLFNACSESSVYPSGLPVIGFKQLVEKEVNGKTIIDSIEHVIPPFTFVDQDSSIITEKTVKGKVFLADFFFTSCPTICPKVKKNMKSVLANFASHTFSALQGFNFESLSHRNYSLTFPATDMLTYTNFLLTCKQNNT